MPASADLLKVLAEDPKSLEQQFGCMTGIFQIFDRHQAFIGRRYGSKRVSNASGQSQPTSACETPRHDRTNPYWMFEDDSSQRISVDSFDRTKGAAEATKEHHHRECSDSSEIFSKSLETPTESRTSPDQKSPHEDQSPMYSEESVSGLAFYYNEPVREATTTASAANPFEHSDLVKREYNNKPNAVLPRVAPEAARVANNKEPLQSSSDIRDIVRASFHRERPREITVKEKPRTSVDGNQCHGYLKNLPRSSSVDGKDRLRLSVDGRETAPKQPADLPRSSSVDGRGSSRMMADWKDVLRHSSGSPRMTSKEKDLLKSSTAGRNSSEGRSDATRLTVELKEGPRLSVSVDDRRSFTEGRASPRPVRSNSRCADQSSDMPVQPFDFKESLRAADFKDTLRSSQKGREGPRFSVDGTRDIPRAPIAPRLSVDGRDSAHSCAVPRRLKLDGRDASRRENRQGIHKKSDYFIDNDTEGDVHRKAPNVVARLMGLEELPNSAKGRHHLPPRNPETRTRETNLLQGFLQYDPHKGSPPPPPPLDDYNYMHSRNYETYDYGCIDHEALHSRSRPASGRHGEREAGQLVEDYPSQHRPEHHAQLRTPLSPGHHQNVERAHSASTRHHQEADQSLPNELIGQPPKQQPSGIHVLLDAAKEQSNEVAGSLPDTLCDQNLDQKVTLRSKQHGRKTLWQILEAMQLKGLLHGSRRKQSEAAKLQNIKAVEEKQQVHVKQEPAQTSLPRLTLAAPKQHDYAGPNDQDTPRASIPSIIKGDSKSHEDNVDIINRVKAKLLQSEAVKSANFENEEASIVLIKPILTRSSSKSQTSEMITPHPREVGTMSSKSSNAGGHGPSTAHSVSEEEKRPRSESIANKNVNHRLTMNESAKSQTLHDVRVSSPLENDNSASTRLSRRDRIAARTTQPFSDVTQSGRDSSPRGPRSNPRPCSSRDSSPLSPRCPGSMESVRVIDAAKARRKPFAVKDKDESKVTFANLRANATKQEFLKGRASGDPDTPRLRRSSSDSKLLSKIAEKPIASDTCATKSVGGGRSPTNSPTLKSKRPIVRDSKSPLKSRPGSALGIKTGAKSPSGKETVILKSPQSSHVLHSILTPTCTRVPVSTAPVQETLAAMREQTSMESEIAQCSSSCSTVEVRITEGGAVDQSSDTTESSNMRVSSGTTSEPPPQSEVQETRADLDEGVKTPRGVSVKKMHFADTEPPEVVEQPSPVSVLDNSHFEEELAPSPRSEKPSVIDIQADKAKLLDSERRWTSARFLDLNLEDASPATVLEVTVPSVSTNDQLETSETTSEDCDNLLAKCLDKYATELKAPTDIHAKTKESKNKLRICLKDADEERTYVKDLVIASQLTDASSFADCLWSTTGYMIDPSIFDQLELNREQGDLSLEKKTSEEDIERDALDRRILFDSVNEILEDNLSPTRWTGLLRTNVCKRPAGQQLIQEVWDKLQDIPCTASDEVCDTVFTILQKDLLKGRGQNWSSYEKELGQITTEVEKMIVKDLIDETVRDLCALGGRDFLPLPFEATRRQLFAY